MQCRRCGAEFFGNFCPICGQAAESTPQEVQPPQAAEQAGGMPPEQVLPQEKPPSGAADVQANAQAAGAQADMQAGVQGTMQADAANVQAGDPAASYAQQIARQAGELTPPPKHKCMVEYWAEQTESSKRQFHRIKKMGKWVLLCIIASFLPFAVVLIVMFVWGGKDPFSLLLEYDGTRAAYTALIWIGAVLFIATVIFDWLYRRYVQYQFAMWGKKNFSAFTAWTEADMNAAQTALLHSEKAAQDIVNWYNYEREACVICKRKKSFVLALVFEATSIVLLFGLVVLFSLFLTDGVFESYAQGKLLVEGAGMNVFECFFSLFGITEENGNMICMLFIFLAMIVDMILYGVLQKLSDKMLME